MLVTVAAAEYDEEVRHISRRKCRRNSYAAKKHHQKMHVIIEKLLAQYQICETAACGIKATTPFPPSYNTPQSRY